MTNTKTNAITMIAATPTKNITTNVIILATDISKDDDKFSSPFSLKKLFSSENATDTIAVRASRDTAMVAHTTNLFLLVLVFRYF